MENKLIKNFFKGKRLKATIFEDKNGSFIVKCFGQKQDGMENLQKMERHASFLDAEKTANEFLENCIY